MARFAEAEGQFCMSLNIAVHIPSKLTCDITAYEYVNQVSN